MKIRNIDAIKEHEALRLTAYLPTKDDVWTIGWGHTKNARQGMVITEAQAEAFLREDLAWVEAALRRLVKVPVNQNQIDALGSLIFNIGEPSFAKSTVLRRLNAGDYLGAAEAFLMWDKQRDKKTGKMNTLRGLTKRRQQERALFLK
jgi:lysozyme